MVQADAEHEDVTQAVAGDGVEGGAQGVLVHVQEPARSAVRHGERDQAWKHGRAVTDSAAHSRTSPPLTERGLAPGRHEHERGLVGRVRQDRLEDGAAIAPLPQHGVELLRRRHDQVGGPQLVRTGRRSRR